MSRPRKCRVCHADATHAERTVRPTTTIDLNGNVRHGQVVHTVYYCADHEVQP